MASTGAMFGYYTYGECSRYGVVGSGLYSSVIPWTAEQCVYGSD